MIKEGTILDEIKDYDLFVESDEDLANLAAALNMEGESDIETLSVKYCQLTGHEVYDYREDSEYTGVNAQSDRDFYDEEALTDNNRKQLR